jgi:DNA ligase 1
MTSMRTALTSSVGSIIAVRANCVMKPGDSSPLHSLFLQRVVEASYRTDKTEPDSLEQVIAQFDAAAKGA